MKISFASRVLHHVTKHKHATVDQVLAAVGMHVDAARAMRAYETSRRAERNRKPGMVEKGPTHPPLEQGRRTVVCHTLKELARRGLLSRVRRGTYKAA